ncbi:MAG TPA: M4 family metallopeptidase, partial [Anaerolinea sp.]|nr:M4 family metallopeptidase [Anaerolinea sp.]
MKRAAYLLVVVGLLAMVFGVSPRAAQSAPPPPDAVQTLQALSGGRAVVDRNPETGLVRFIGTDLAHPVAAQTALAAASAGDAARQFAREYAGLFGVSSPDTDLSELRSETTPDGQTYVRYQQTYQGIPVMAGELIVHLDGANRLLSMNGEALDGITVSAQPGLDAAAAQQIALQVVAQQYGLAADGLQASQPALWVYNPRLLGDPSLPVTGLVWRMDVTAGAQDPVKELVLVDAQSGRVRLHFNQIDAALDRTVYDWNNNFTYTLPGPASTLARKETDVVPTGNLDVDYAFDFAGQTYNFFLSKLGRDSVDGAG